MSSGAALTAAHLERAAYVQQTSVVQVKNNVERQRLQCALSDYAKELGFHDVEVIDEDLGIYGAVGGGAGAFGGQSELPSDGFVHVEHVAGGQGDVAHPIQAGMEGCGDVAAHGGFARTGLAGEQSDALEFDEVIQACLGLAPGVRFEQLVGVSWGLEGQRGEGEVMLVHQFFSVSLCRVSGEGGGRGGGVSHWSCQEWRSRLTAVLA